MKVNSSQKRLLILTEDFVPGFAPRMGYLAKYLQLYEWIPVVVSPQSKKRQTFDFLSGFAEYHMVGYYNSKSHNSFFLHIWNFLYRTIKKKWSWSEWDEKVYCISKDLFHKQNFDIVLCSTCSFFPLEVAYKISKEFSVPLILDFRDIYEQTEESFCKSIGERISINLYRRRRNKILGKADAVVTVSSWHCDFLKRYNPNVYLVFNGYDPELFYNMPFEKRETFDIVYTGTLLPFGDMTVRNPLLILESIAVLAEKDLIKPGSFRLIFYTTKDSIDRVSALAADMHISEYVYLEDMVPMNQVPYILSKGSLLLVLTSLKSHGIMTTKLFEYIAVKRFILCIPNDEYFIESVLSKTNSGISLSTVDDIANLILEKYSEWQDRGEVSCPSKMDVVESYSRKEQAKQFVEVFDRVLDKIFE